MRAVLVLAAVIAAAPAIAVAQTPIQTPTERRELQVTENLRQLEQNQRIGEIERQVSNIQLQRQSEEALRALQPRPVVPTPSPSVAASVNPYVDPLYNNQLHRLNVDPAENPYLVPGYGSQIRRQTGTVTETPYVAPPSGLTPRAPSPEDLAMDAALAASNARIRAIAQAQRAD